MPVRAGTVFAILWVNRDDRGGETRRGSRRGCDRNSDRKFLGDQESNAASAGRTRCLTAAGARNLRFSATRLELRRGTTLPSNIAVAGQTAFEFRPQGASTSSGKCLRQVGKCRSQGVSGDSAIVRCPCWQQPENVWANRPFFPALAIFTIWLRAEIHLRLRERFQSCKAGVSSMLYRNIICLSD